MRCHPAREQPVGLDPGAASRGGPGRGGSGHRWSRSRCPSAEKPLRIRLHLSRAESLNLHERSVSVTF